MQVVWFHFLPCRFSSKHTVQSALARISSWGLQASLWCLDGQVSRLEQRWLPSHSARFSGPRWRSNEIIDYVEHCELRGRTWTKWGGLWASHLEGYVGKFCQHLLLLYALWPSRALLSSKSQMLDVRLGVKFYFCVLWRLFFCAFVFFHESVTVLSALPYLRSWICDSGEDFAKPPDYCCWVGECDWFGKKDVCQKAHAFKRCVGASLLAVQPHGYSSQAQNRFRRQSDGLQLDA